ncbi:MAG: histidine phosphatase family protein [Nanoarchaeota archaeon]|nr:histidine phosphatase family protein [Nanoarchaeota archaeon]
MEKQLMFDFDGAPKPDLVRKVFVIRHGDYKRATGDLKSSGVRFTERLARKMQEVVGEIREGFYLWSSSAPRCRQTADIIADVFGIDDVEEDKRLQTGGNVLPRGTLELIDERFEAKRGEVEIFGVCTHYEIVGAYPNHFVKKYFDTDTRFNRPHYCEAVCIDVGSGEGRLLTG